MLAWHCYVFTIAFALIGSTYFLNYFTTKIQIDHLIYWIDDWFLQIQFWQNKFTIHAFHLAFNLYMDWQILISLLSRRTFFDFRTKDTLHFFKSYTVVDLSKQLQIIESRKNPRHEQNLFLLSRQRIGISSWKHNCRSKNKHTPCDRQKYTVRKIYLVQK